MEWIPAPSGSFPDYTQATAPSSPSSGEFWWDTSVHVLKRYNGSSWEWVGLDDLSNVDTSGKADTNIVEWDTGSSNWVDVVKPSGGASGTWTLIAEDDLASAGSITFSSIPASYDFLRIVGPIRLVRTGGGDQVRVRVGNGSVDTGTNYSYFHYTKSNFGTSPTGATAANGMRIGHFPASSAASGVFGTLDLTISMYAETGSQRHFLAVPDAWYDTVSGDYHSTQSGGHWKNTADAIDIVTITAWNGTNLAAGSHLKLYGIT